MAKDVIELKWVKRKGLDSNIKVEESFTELGTYECKYNLDTEASVLTFNDTKINEWKKANSNQIISKSFAQAHFNLELSDAKKK